VEFLADTVDEIVLAYLIAIDDGRPVQVPAR
jgi:hypothetical protein